MATLKNEVAVAVNKLLEKGIKASGYVPAVGVIEIDEVVTLRVKATLKKGADVEYTPTASIPLKTTLALLLARMGLQREKAAEMLVGAMQEALRVGDEAGEYVAGLLKDVDESMKRVTELTEKLPKETRKGSVTVTGSIEVAEFVQMNK